jgi:hypothetical protein
MRGLSLLLLLAACADGGNPSEDGAAYSDDCDASLPCSEGLSCAGSGTCLALGEPGTAQLDDDCVPTAYCESGLV